MIEIDCQILEEKIINSILCFRIKSVQDNEEYEMPKKIFQNFNIKVGDTHTFYKVFNKIENCFSLNLKKQIKEFKIIGFDKILLKNGENVDAFCVEDDLQNRIKVRTLPWQNIETWQHKYLNCEIDRYDYYGHARLINRDYRHPFYKVGEIYEFDIIDSNVVNVKDKQYNVFQILGEDGCKYQVNITPGQILNQIVSGKISCRVVDITHRVSLSQVNIRDAFYVTAEKIISDTELIRKYFNPLFDAEIESDFLIGQLVDQYNSGSAYWVFTFTKIISKNFQEYIRRENYHDAKEINTLILIFEKWILSKGIITSMSNELLKEATLKKAKLQLEEAQTRDIILTELVANRYDLLQSTVLFPNTGNNLKNLYYLFSFCNIVLLDEKLFVQLLIKYLDATSTDSVKLNYYLNNLWRAIDYKKYIFIDKRKEEYFSLTSNTNNSSLDKENNSKYIYYTYCQLLISVWLKEYEHCNILIGQLLKRWNSNITELEIKLCILLNSYNYFENYQNVNFAIPFYFDNRLELDYNKLINASGLEQNEDNNWFKIEESFSLGLPMEVKLTKKSNSGYEVEYNSFKGFLPSRHLADRILKTYPFEKCNFITNVRCISYSKLFRFFIVEQVPTANKNYYFKNNNIFKTGSIYEGVIKSVVNYGCFISTECGDGLLYKNKIFNSFWDYRDILKLFQPNDKIRVIAKEVDETGKIVFNFSEMESLDNKYYNEFIERVYERYSPTYHHTAEEFETEFTKETYFDIVQKEKAFCFEQNALLQKNINDKLHSFRLAKQFYAISKDARSYLINIYTSYFEVLLKIQNCLEIQSLEGISEIKQNSISIKNKINTKTLATFPDSEKLIYFLNIIGLFNEINEESLELLFEYIKQHSINKKENLLKTIAKITMANNLIVSEGKDTTDFCLKNLKLIFNYISDGILSLSETIEDKCSRELREDILYWRERIKGDESETLEFKSSFFTPILTEIDMQLFNKLKIISNQTDEVKIGIERINGALAKKRLIHSSLKTLSAFANTSGGTLLLGVSDEKKILGLEVEYLSFKKKDQNRDGFGKYFDDMVKSYLGESFSSLITRKYIKFPEGDILTVIVKPSIHEVFLLKDEEGKDSEQLYIRNLSSSKALWGQELAKFIRTRDIERFKNKVLNE